MCGVFDNDFFDLLVKTRIKVAKKSGLKFHFNSYFQRAEEKEKKHSSMNELMRQSTMTT
jgi:hypothetical protein